MSATATVTTGTKPMKGYELKIVRTFDAPRELVWKAWTDSEMLKHWMGPRGFTATEYTMGGSVGASWHMKMQGHIPGTEKLGCLGQGGKVLEIDPPRLLKFTLAWDRREDVGLAESPYKENIVTVQLEESGNKTVMTFTQGPFATEGEFQGHTGGWNSAFDKFAEFVLAEQPDRKPDPNDIPTEFHVKRFFAAPRQLVFDAWTKPEMVAEWFGPEGFTIDMKKWEAHQGGEIHLTMNGFGASYPMMGKFIEVYPPYRFHFTAWAPDKNGNPMFENWNSLFFEAVEGGTMMTLDVHVRTHTPEAEQSLKGMTQGWNQTLDKLTKWIEAKQ